MHDLCPYNDYMLANIDGDTIQTVATVNTFLQGIVKNVTRDFRSKMKIHILKSLWCRRFL